MLGIEISTDFLIIAVLMQIAIITILILLILFRLKKFSHSPSSSSSAPPLPLPLPVDLDLNKKIEKTLTDIQIKLDEISAELSTTKKEQNKAIANLATLVADTVNTATGTAATVAASATAPIISSELFDRYSDTHSPKSEFLELDLDSSSSANESSNESKIKDSNHYTVINLEDSNHPTDASSIKSASTAISSTHLTSSGHMEQSVKDDIHKNIRFSEYYQNPKQYTNYQLNHSNNSQHVSGNMIKGQKDQEGRKEENNNFRTQNENQNPSNKLEGLHLSNEKISNPELDKIDEEILSALQRLGEVDHANSNNNKELVSKEDERLNDTNTSNTKKHSNDDENEVNSPASI